MPITLTGTTGNDNLNATTLDDYILDGGAGNDTLIGLVGNDLLLGGTGDDYLEGFSGANTLDGGSGTDTAIYQGHLTDYAISFNSATSTFTIVSKTSGGISNSDQVTNVESFFFALDSKFYTASELLGGAGPDTTPPTVLFFTPTDGMVGVPVNSPIGIVFSESVKLGSGSITLRDASGNVIEVFSANSSHLLAAGSTLVITPSAALGYSSSYTVELTPGVVTDLSGNAFTGNPEYHFTTVGANGGAVQQGDDGPNTLVSGPGNDTLIGGGGDDTLIGSAGDNVLDGGTGNDNLSAGAGDDTLIGGPGSDTMAGGDGADIYYVDDAGDVVIETATNAAESTDGHPADLGRSVDKVIASISYTLTSFVENLSLATAAGNLSANGNDLNNVLTGNDGNNVMMGGAGNDTLDGGAGFDTAQYSGKFSNYKLSADTSQPVPVYTVADQRANTNPNDGTDSVTNVERLQFSDENLAFDLGSTQAAGKAVLVMTATLGSAFPHLKDWAGTFLKYFDSGASVLDGTTLLFATGIMPSVVAALTGGSDNASLAKAVYANTHGGNAPDAATLATMVAQLSTTTPAQWMADQALSSANQVQLTGYVQTGLEYIPA